MEITKKVGELEKEIQELRVRITNLEEVLKNPETFFSNIKNKNNTNPFVRLTEVNTGYNDIYHNLVGITNKYPWSFISNINNNTNQNLIGPEAVTNNDDDSVFSTGYNNDNNLEVLTESNNDNNLTVSKKSNDSNNTSAVSSAANDDNNTSAITTRANDDSNNSTVLTESNNNINSTVSTESNNDNNSVVSIESDNDNNSVVSIESNNDNNSVVSIESNNDNNSVVSIESNNDKNSVVSIESNNDNNSAVSIESNNDNNSVVSIESNNDNNSSDHINFESLFNDISTKQNNTEQNNTSNENLIPEFWVNKILTDFFSDVSAKNLNTESWIGKILMGVLASLLVFIALITFAKALLPYLTNTIKIILMFATSIALTGTGFVFSKKKPENTVYKAILACGSASIYISILATGIYFKAVDFIIMYVLIALWALLIIFLKKDKDDKLFFVIGNLGYFVSILYTAELKDNSLILPMLVYVIMIGVFYQIMYWKNEHKRYIQSIINVIALLLFQTIMLCIFKKITEVIIIEMADNNNSWLFFVIGNLGYLVSIIFTKELKDRSLILPLLVYVIMVGVFYQIMYWKNEHKRYIQSIINDRSLILPLLVYVIMVGVFYQIMFWKNKYHRHTQNVINVISLLLFQTIMLLQFGRKTEVIIIEIVVMVITTIGFLVYVLSDFFNHNKVHFYVAIVNIVAYFIAYFFLLFTVYNDLPVVLSFAVFIFPAVVLEILNMYWRSKHLAKYESFVNAIFSGGLFYAAATILSMSDHFLFYSGTLLVVYSMIAIYGIIKKDLFFKVQGWILVYIFMVKGMFQFSNLTFTIVATILTLTSLITEGIVINDSEFFKIISYIVLLEWIGKIGVHVYDLKIVSSNIETVNLLIYGIMALLNMVLILTKFYKTKEKDENGEREGEGRKSHFVLDIFNLVFMFYNCYKMSILDDNSLKIVYTIILFVLGSINLPVKDKGASKRYMYSAIKFYIIIWYSLNAFDAPSYVISICIIAFSVVCVAIGFSNKLIGKELRVFGLVMTLIFVIKLIIIDINFDSSVLKALSYLISGILCFGISAIYNYFDSIKQKTD
ncbi:hypothetical protein U3516DRAFT_549227 [Neocallimastix sp. 'constans']